MALSDLKCRRAKCPEDKKQIKLTDEKGMHLLVNKSGKYWRFDYRYADKRKTMAFGVYPETSLIEARAKRDEARKTLRDGRDPGKERQIQQENNFEAIAKEWLTIRKLELAPSTTRLTEMRLKNDINPHIGDLPVNTIRASDILSMLQNICDRGAEETAHRCRSIVGQVLRYAIVTNRAESDPTPALRGAIRRPEGTPMATMLDPKEIGKMMRGIDNYKGTPVVRIALQLIALLFVRPGNLRFATWSEINWKKAEWRIPAHKMKIKNKGDHIVALSTQALALLHELHPITGHGELIFPGVRSPMKPISENTLNHALRYTGVGKGKQVAHGFRAMARTLLAEEGWNPEYIESQLAHAKQSKVIAAYDRAKFLKERKEMMQAWADHLDELKAE